MAVSWVLSLEARFIFVYFCVVVSSNTKGFLSSRLEKKVGFRDFFLTFYSRYFFVCYLSNMTLKCSHVLGEKSEYKMKSQFLALGK